MDKIVDRINYLVDNKFVVTPLAGKKPLLKGWQNIPLEESRSVTISALEKGSANNFGIVTGKVSDIVVIDIDKRGGGIDSWLKLIKGKQLEETFVVETGSGGYHIYYQWDPRLASCRRITEWSIDFKSDGGQVVAPGSIHPDTGKVYSVVYGYIDDNIVLATFPEFLIPIFYGYPAK